MFAVASTLLFLPSGAVSSQLAPAVDEQNDIFAGQTRDPYQLAMRAYVWGYPMVRAAQIRQNMTVRSDPFRVARLPRAMRAGQPNGFEFAFKPYRRSAMATLSEANSYTTSLDTTS
jgi:hypothetical protein